MVEGEGRLHNTCTMNERTSNNTDTENLTIYVSITGIENKMAQLCLSRLFQSSVSGCNALASMLRELLQKGFGKQITWWHSVQPNHLLVITGQCMIMAICKESGSWLFLEEAACWHFLTVALGSWYSGGRRSDTYLPGTVSKFRHVLVALRLCISHQLPPAVKLQSANDISW